MVGDHIDRMYFAIVRNLIDDPYQMAGTQGGGADRGVRVKFH